MHAMQNTQMRTYMDKCRDICNKLFQIHQLIDLQFQCVNKKEQSFFMWNINPKPWRLNCFLASSDEMQPIFDTNYRVQ